MSERHSLDDAAGPLPDAPEPSLERRERTIEAALSRFDALAAKGSEPEPRPRSRHASWRTPVMVRARPALAAAAVVAIATPIAWMIAQERAAQAPVVPVENSGARKDVDTETARTQARGKAEERARADAAEAVAKQREERKPEATAERQVMADVPAPPVPAPSAVPPPPPMVAAKPAAPPAGANPHYYRRLAQREGEARRSYAPSPAPADAVAELPPPQAEPVGEEKFEGKPVSGFRSVREAPVSTFSIDVDTASYGFLRASLARNTLPPPDAVRTEELINYFPYAYPVSENRDTPFKVTASVFPSPWAAGRKIVRVGIKGYDIPKTSRPHANLVFLIDTSGSMNGPNRLPLVKQSLALLLGTLDAKDRVAIVTYAGSAGTALEPTPASEKGKILAAIEKLGAGGGTAGSEGLREAYALAERNYDKASVNRVILATDGDFNIGISDREQLKGFVERKRETGIFLSVLGFGMGNTNDALMQALAQNGNGTAATIDTLNEARKVLVEEASSTLFPIAKDVKIQVEFNPAAVAEYRQIGYETRQLNRDDFENDKVDAGEVGSGQGVTALYEIVPTGGPRTVSDLRYGKAEPVPAATGANEYAFVKVRYKKPDQDTSQLIETPVTKADEKATLSEADEDARFATAVAGFGEILRGGRWTGKFTLDDVLKTASAARGEDPFGYRSEFLQLVRAAKTAQALQAARP